MEMEIKICCNCTLHFEMGHGVILTSIRLDLLENKSRKSRETAVNHYTEKRVKHTNGLQT